MSFVLINTYHDPVFFNYLGLNCILMVFTLPAHPNSNKSSEKIFYNGQPIDSVVDESNKISSTQLNIQDLPLFQSVGVTINEILSEIVNRRFNGSMDGARWFHVGLFIMFFGIIIGIVFSFMSNVYNLKLQNRDKTV